MDNLEIIITGDGSHSLRDTTINETFHSTHGAIQESMHVFIEHGLRYAIQKHAGQEIRILEIGFGTGLNALLTLEESVERDLRIAYSSIELHPLTPDLLSKMNFPELINGANTQVHYKNLHDAPWNQPTQLLSNFTLEKLLVDLTTARLDENAYDLVYYDAFAPSRQPEMWTLPILDAVARSMKSQAVFVTYCAKGQLKRDLKSVGLYIETLAGPPGKKEMVRATKP